VSLRLNELCDVNIEMVKAIGFTHRKKPTVKDSDMKSEGVSELTGV